MLFCLEHWKSIVQDMKLTVRGVLRNAYVRYIQRTIKFAVIRVRKLERQIFQCFHLYVQWTFHEVNFMVIDYADALSIIESFKVFLHFWLKSMMDSLQGTCSREQFSRFRSEIGRSQGLTCDHPLIHSKLTSGNAR